MTWDSLGKYQNIALLICRLGIGLSYVVIHGAGKIFGGPEKWASIGKAVNNFKIDLFPAFWGFMASISEFLGGILIVLGLLFRPAALFIFITMIVAASNHYYKGDPLSKIAYPLEMAMIMILFFFIGPGKYSLDNMIWKKKG